MGMPCRLQVKKRPEQEDGDPKIWLSRGFGLGLVSCQRVYVASFGMPLVKSHLFDVTIQKSVERTIWIILSYSEYTPRVPVHLWPRSPKSARITQSLCSVDGQLANVKLHSPHTAYTTWREEDPR